MSPKVTPTWVLYVLTVAIWGTSWYGIELQMGVVPAQVSLAYRFVLASAILFGWCLFTGRSLVLPARAHLWMALQGLMLFSVNYILFYFASQHIVSGLMAVCFSTIAVMNIVNEALLFGRRIDRMALLAALIGLGGLCLLFWPELSGETLGERPWLGFGLSLIATYCASLGNMVSVKLKALAIPVVQSNTIGMGYGALINIGWALGLGLPFAFDPRAPYVVSLLALALFATAIGFGCYLTLVQRIGAGRAGYLTVMFPIVALTVSTFLEGYAWSVPAVLGTLLVLSGNLIVLAGGRLRRAPAGPAIGDAAQDTLRG